jgi:hypothetical protein
MSRLTGSSYFRRSQGHRDADLTSPVREAIGQAERHIAARQFGRAQECLADAWRLDPGNPYIPAIIERIEILQSMARDESSKRSSSQRALRYLATTVGARYPEGLKPEPEDAPDRDIRVHRLMTVALSLAERGSIEPAFQALKKGYLMDPQHPEVRTCADRIVPLWQARGGRLSLGELSSQSRAEDVPGAAAVEAQMIAAQRPPRARATPEEQRRRDSHAERLQNLLEQREKERRAREQAVWRAASIPLRRSGTAARKANGNVQEDSSSRPKSGIIPAWLRWKSPR